MKIPVAYNDPPYVTLVIGSPTQMLLKEYTSHVEMVRGKHAITMHPNHAIEHRNTDSFKEKRYCPNGNWIARNLSAVIKSMKIAEVSLDSVLKNPARWQTDPFRQLLS